MTPPDIRMCVADVMQDDEIENIDSVLRMLNNASESSWRIARGQDFEAEEVRFAIRELLNAGMVTACAETPPWGDLMRVALERVDIELPIDSLWFRLEYSGRQAVQEWWKSVGRIKFPLDQAD